MTETVWKNGRIVYDRIKIMGILNVTPDSFSDGGKNARAEEAAFEMIDNGADIIDIGGESTRPGYTPVAAEEEIARVLPAVRRLSESSSITISVDTMKPYVAERALDAGAHIINDVGGLRDESMINVIASYGAAVVIMHMPRDPAIVHETYMEGDPMTSVRSYLLDKASKAAGGGIDRRSIIIDPGFGFGKTNEQNISLLNDLKSLSGTFPVLAGMSRKRFLASMFPSLSRDDASLEAAKIAAGNGASVVRVHDVKRTKDALGLRY